MGGYGSGRYNRPTIKLGTYKIFSFERNGVPFYFGVSKNFLCKIKTFYCWRAKNRVVDTENNKLFDYIQLINYDFEIKELEILTGYSRKEARLYLQEKYLDNKSCDILNVLDFCYCQKEVLNHRLPMELKQNMIDDYLLGLKTQEIAKKYGVEQTKIITILRTNKMNKKKLFQMACNEYNGNNLDTISKKYNLSKYMKEKLLNNKEYGN